MFVVLNAAGRQIWLVRNIKQIPTRSSEEPGQINPQTTCFQNLLIFKQIPFLSLSLFPLHLTPIFSRIEERPVQLTTAVVSTLPTTHACILGADMGPCTVSYMQLVACLISLPPPKCPSLGLGTIKGMQATFLLFETPPENHSQAEECSLWPYPVALE